MPKKFGLSHDHNSQACLSFYTEVPISDIGYEEFKQIVKDRIKILRKVENGTLETYPIRTEYEDLVGHAGLKLIAAQAKWAVNWFVKMETALMRKRLELCPKSVESFFIKKIWPCLNISTNIDPETHFSLANANPRPFDPSILVHFSKCSDILPKRKYEISRGYFQFNPEILVSLIVTEYTRHLEATMNIMYEQMTSQPDERLGLVFSDLLSLKPVATESIDNAINKRENYPLCIQGILDKMAKNKHLKYNDRQVLARFLKDIGVPIEETIALFKSSFNISEGQFNKEYLYNIRHTYGLEGRRANYSSFSCIKIAGMSGESHTVGCPFMNNHEYVKDNGGDIEDIGRDVLHACCGYAEKKGGTALEGRFMSPAEYFRLLEAAQNKKFQVTRSDAE